MPADATDWEAFVETGDAGRFFRDAILNRHYNEHPGLIDGSKWPPGSLAVSMAGQRRLDHVAALIATAVAEGRPGHFIETGVWRGGLSFLAARTFDVLGADRLVYLCDSFSGIPDQKAYGAGRRRARPPDGSEQDGRAHLLDILNSNSEARVRADAALFGLEATRLRFVPGYFNASLPALLSREPEVVFAVMCDARGLFPDKRLAPAPM